MSRSDQSEINLKPLRKVKLKGAWVPGFLISFLGGIDHFTKVIKTEEHEQEKDGKKMRYMTAYSTYISNSQSRYDQYVSHIYEKSGYILRHALITREKINDQIYLLSKELDRVEKSMPGDADALLEASSVEQKRMIASAKRTIQGIRQEMANKELELKKIKIQLDEALHEIDEILIQKRNVVTRQKHCYLKGAHIVAMPDKNLIQINRESQERFEKLTNKDFRYCLDLKQLFGGEEKGSGK